MQILPEGLLLREGTAEQVVVFRAHCTRHVRTLCCCHGDELTLISGGIGSNDRGYLSDGGFP